MEIKQLHYCHNVGVLDCIEQVLLCSSPEPSIIVLSSID